MPYDDLNITVREGWESIRQTIIDGVEFTIKEQKNGLIVRNNLPSKKNNPIVHIRPHTSKRYYALHGGMVIGDGNVSNSDLLPDGQRMTKQSFWLNNSYVLDQIKGLL